MMLALVFTGVARVLLLGQDDPSVNDADLQLTRLEIPDEENAWFYFEKAAREFEKYMEQATRNPATLEKSRKRRITAQKIEKVTSLFYRHKWQPDQAKKVLGENQKLLEYFDEGMACQKIQIPEIAFSTQDDGINISQQYISWVNSLRALYLFDTGQEKEAFDETMKTIRFGQRIENSSGSMSYFLGGQAIKAEGMKHLRDFLKITSLSSEALKPYVAELQNYRITLEGWSNTIKQEYHIFSDSIGDTSTEKLHDEMEPDVSYDSSGLHSPLFLPKNTKNLMAEFYRKMIQNGSLPYAQQKPLTPFESEGLKSLLTRNSEGKAGINISIPIYNQFLLMKYMENNEVAATRCMIALKCYQLNKGELPESLAQLVPTYLDAVPLDDFDGKPLRYNREKKILYSVGEDLIDNGGVINPQNRKQEMVYKIEF
jgi:hypothetical protein